MKVNVDRMRRYQERGTEAAEEQQAARDWQRKLSRMTPEHRAKHETRGALAATGGLCGECFQASLQPIYRLARQMEERRKAREERHP